MKGELKRKMLQGSIVTISVQGTKLIVQIVSIAVLGRLMSAEDFGIVGMVMAFTVFMARFRDMGLGVAIVQKGEVEQRELSGVLQLSMCVGGALLVICILASPLLVAFYDEERVRYVVMLAGVALLFGAPSVVPIGIMRRNLQFAHVAFLDLGSFALGIACSILMAWRGFAFWSPIAGNVVAAMSLLVISWTMLGRNRPAIFIRGCMKDAYSLAKRGASLTGVELLNYFGLNLDKILLGRYAGPMALGHYTRAYALSIQPATQVLSPIGAVIIPSLSRLRNDKQAYMRFFERLYSITLLLSIPLATAIILLSDDLFYLLMGPGWGNAAKIAGWLGLMLFTKPCASVIYWMFLTQDRNPLLIKWSAWNALINIITFIVSAQYGVYVLAASYALAGLIIRNPLAFIFTGKLKVLGVWYLVRVYLMRMGALAVLLISTYYCREALADQTLLLRLFACLLFISLATLVFLFISADGRWLMGVAYRKVWGVIRSTLFKK